MMFEAEVKPAAIIPPAIAVAMRPQPMKPNLGPDSPLMLTGYDRSTEHCAWARSYIG